jgi:hypothetical protein
LRERVNKLEACQHSSNASSNSHASKCSSNEQQQQQQQQQQQDSLVADSDDWDSNISSHSTSSTINPDAVIEQPKYFDRKRRLLAAEQQISPSDIDAGVTKKSNAHKKTCLDDIVDSLNQKAQAERDEDDEHQPDDVEECLDEIEGNRTNDDQVDQDVNKSHTPTDDTPTGMLTTTTTTPSQAEREEDDEDIDIDDPKLTVDDDH